MVRIKASHEGARKLMVSKRSFRSVVELSVEREREMGNRVVKGEGWERLLMRNRETVERSGKVQNCMGRICSFPSFMCLCFNTLPL